MQINQDLAAHPVIQAGERRSLKVQMVGPLLNQGAAGTVSLGGILMALGALALQRFGAERGEVVPTASCRPAVSSAALVPADPFDGRLLRLPPAGAPGDWGGVRPGRGAEAGGGEIASWGNGGQP